jgi:hypothetical protein
MSEIKFNVEYHHESTDSIDHTICPGMWTLSCEMPSTSISIIREFIINRIFTPWVQAYGEHSCYVHLDMTGSLESLAILNQKLMSNSTFELELITRDAKDTDSVSVYVCFEVDSNQLTMNLFDNPLLTPTEVLFPLMLLVSHSDTKPKPQNLIDTKPQHGLATTLPQNLIDSLTLIFTNPSPLGGRYQVINRLVDQYQMGNPIRMLKMFAMSQTIKLNYDDLVNLYHDLDFSCVDLH